MASRGWCPACDALKEITPTGEDIYRDGSSRWWRLVMHKCRGPLKELCPGSGEKI